MRPDQRHGEHGSEGAGEGNEYDEAGEEPCRRYHAPTPAHWQPRVACNASPRHNTSFTNVLC